MSTLQSRAKTIFLQALELVTITEREAYLDTQCGTDADLRREVEQLLRHHGDVGSFLESPPTAVVDSAEQLHTIAPLPPSLEFLSPSSRADSLGRLGHYEILEVVGSGGMGIVLKAFDEQLHRIVAIKAMTPSLAASGTGRQRFVREAQAAAAVNHDNVIDIYAVEEAGPVPYLAMEYVAGISLEDKLKQEGPLELKEILRIGLQTADGLAAAHRQGLVHRDVKPANILLENGVGRVKVTDFGLARAADDVSVTQTGVIAGTPAYMSPEQARGEAVDHRSDLFSLGSVLYALCAGRTPFRGSTSLSVLNQVCEERPQPIRDLNPDIPEWLCAIIERLHAKLPAERFQSATELAEVLGRYLAHVQQPSLPLPTAIVPVAAPQKPHTPNTALKSRHDRRRWAVAAVAALVVLALTLTLTDASGITQLAATVIRMFTADGTLVVEVDDPGVKVTVEGDGGLVITGAGLEEIRLRPGSYKVQADRDGKPVVLDREVVSIAKGGREVVRVKLEAPPAPVVARTEKGAFVRLGGKGVAERNFDTLVEAVHGASSGDTIEIRGNGPFVCSPIAIRGGNALTIRAGDGFRPVIQFTLEGLTTEVPLVFTDSRLVLEGLEFRRVSERRKDGGVPHAFRTTARIPVHVAHCRFAMKDQEVYFSGNMQVAEFLNSEFVGAGSQAVMYYPPAGGRLLVTNCVLNGTVGLGLQSNNQDMKDVTVRLTGNTVIAHRPICTSITRLPHAPGGDRTTKSVRLDATGNVFAGERVLFHTFLAPEFLDPAKPLDAAGTELVVGGLHAWRGEQNLYPADLPLLVVSDSAVYPRPLTQDFKSLATWKTFWDSPEVGCLQATPRFRGGDLVSKLAKGPEYLTPDDFRLRADSPGYRAGKDGKDLGADVDLVGPGAAYERWKKTPEYQQWLKETKQVTKAEASTAEPKAFVVLTGKGVEVRRYDTLAEAVRGASDGDTIEIRGNGPFATEPIDIKNQSLIIRAADGFRPVLKQTAEAVEKCLPLLETSAPLVLEGLELQQVSPTNRAGGLSSMLVSHEAPLWLANCRLFMKDQQQHCVSALYCPTVEMHNCEFFINGQGLLLLVDKSSKCLVSNCVLAGALGNMLGVSSGRPGAREALVRLERNTLVTSTWGLVYTGVGGGSSPKHWGLRPEHKLVRIKAADNILDAKSALTFSQYPITPPQELWSGLKGQEAETEFQKMIQWDDGRNVFSPGASSICWLISGGFDAPHGPKSLASWKKFWGNQNADALEGQVRYQGGNLPGLLASGPEKLTAEHFRLRPDSAGYRAGPDGRDLGADVDLVGPGPAYERWKKTPEYQVWLKDTGHVSGQ